LSAHHLSGVLFDLSVDAQQGADPFHRTVDFTYLLSRDAFWMVVQQSAIFALSAVFFKALIGLITAHLIKQPSHQGQRKWRGMLLVRG